MTNPRIKFRYVIVKHEDEQFAIHEAYTNFDGKVLAISGEPVTLRGYCAREMFDMANMIAKDVKEMLTVSGDIDELYNNFDMILAGAFDFKVPDAIEEITIDNSKILEFKKK